ncbi:DNA (cytosine-5-)-methyltransferase [Psychrobacter sp. SCQQ22]|uniref:DNA (cytosine-5-)-methyltransferase n=1 Tax=Psychrobacter sp. SCQQ22 TaxID=2792059 RepID=UPI0018CD762C|nr:DNA (cytosine-5-)-methyltransferase [Psychrobacter sp. SCQQ22]MBH0086599.1 DNA (cytosine-5-)-methyltransferase [Psychrobacter sp. SCQQ22]
MIIVSPTHLKLIRKKVGLTQKKISEMLNVSSKTWQQWESGKTQMHEAYYFSLKENLKDELDIDSLILEVNNQTDNESITLRQIEKNGEQLAKDTHVMELAKAKDAKFTFIDLFAGIGGIRQGFERNGGCCVFSSEKDKFAQFTYYSNFGIVPFGDITTLDIDAVPDHDVLCAGFPCQPFSSIGKREGFEHPTQGTMFHEIVRILERKKPSVVFLENVPGIVNHEGGETLDIIIKTLGTLGYKVDYKILNASDFGVPQSRKRFYLVAYLDHTREFTFPKPPMIESNIGDFVEKDIQGYTISKHLQKSYLFKIDDGKPTLIDQQTRGSTKTLVASYHKIQRLTGTFVKDGETGIRLLSENECKALMGFPKDFKIPVSRTQMYRQMGNSVVIPVIEEMAASIVPLLSGK